MSAVKNFSGCATGVENVTDNLRFTSRYALEMKVPTLHEVAKAARIIGSDERVPYAFEKRIISRLKSLHPQDISAMLSSMMWRAALSCLAISLITGAAITFAGSSTGELLAGDLERTVLAPVDVEDTW